MGGFTRPRDLRSANWWPGGRYRALGKVYERPVAGAYVPHTTFVLESRYPVVHGIGRADAREHITGVCRAGDLPAVLRHYNSPAAPRAARELMDNARWPWRAQKPVRPAPWWEPGEHPRAVRQAVLDDVDAPPVVQQLYPADQNKPYEDVIPAPVDPNAPDPKEEARARRRAKYEAKLAARAEAEEDAADAADVGAPPLEAPPPLPTKPAARLPPPAAASRELGQPRALHTSAPARAAELPTDVLSGRITAARVTDVRPPLEEQRAAVRAEYEPTLAHTPFWRPLLTATFATRPLAMTHARLARALPRGTPFHAVISSDDRKTRHTLSARMRCLRLARACDLALDIARLLDGWRGGFLGVRFAPDGAGRGIDGADLATGTPFAQRRVLLGAGAWYPRAAEVLAGARADADEGAYALTPGPAGARALETFTLDEFGVRTDGEPWPAPAPTEEDALRGLYAGEDIELELDDDEDAGPEARELAMRRALNARKDALAREKPRELARALAERGPRGVSSVQALRHAADAEVE
jgi:hypothetical protein